MTAHWCVLVLAAAHTEPSMAIGLPGLYSNLLLPRWNERYVPAEIRPRADSTDA